jgi:hypothetical protein
MMQWDLEDGRLDHAAVLLVRFKISWSGRQNPAIQHASSKATELSSESSTPAPYGIPGCSLVIRITASGFIIDDKLEMVVVV